MTDMTLVNSYDAKDGSVQIGKLTEKPDVPVEFYKYEPVSEKSDPGFSVVVNPDEMSDEERMVRRLSDLQTTISKNGVNYETVVALEEIVPGIIMSNFPSTGYSNELSEQSLQITLERIDIAKVTGVVAAIVAVIGLIYSLINRVAEGNSQTELPAKAAVQKAQQNEATKVKDIEKNAREVERIAKRNHEALQFLIERRIGDCILLHKRLNPSLNVDEASQNPVKYIEELSRVKNLFDLNGILSNNMPALFFMSQSQLRATLAKYMAFLDKADEAIRDRVDNIAKMIQYYHELKTNADATFTFNNVKLLKLLNDFTGRNDTDERAAVEEFTRQVTMHWAMPQNAKASIDMASNMISNEFTSTFNRLVQSGQLLQKTAQQSKFIAKDADIRRHFKYIEIATQEVNKALASPNIGEVQRSRLLISLRKLEQAPNQFQSEYRIVRSHIVAIIRPVANAGRAARAMRSNLMGYNRLVDDLYDLLEDFKTKFGEEK